MRATGTASLRTTLTALAIAGMVWSQLAGISTTTSPRWSTPPSSIALLSHERDFGVAQTGGTPTPSPAEARGPGRDGPSRQGLLTRLIRLALIPVGFLLSVGLMVLFGRRRRPSKHSLNDRGPNTPAGAPELTANTARGGLTAADVRNVVFSKPALGETGYNQDEVDALLDRIYAKLLDSQHSSLTAAEVHHFAFSNPPSGRRGYNRDEVDAFLDLVQAEIRRLDTTT